MQLERRGPKHKAEEPFYHIILLQRRVRRYSKKARRRVLFWVVLCVFCFFVWSLSRQRKPCLNCEILVVALFCHMLLFCSRTVLQDQKRQQKKRHQTTITVAGWSSFFVAESFLFVIKLSGKHMEKRKYKKEVTTQTFPWVVFLCDHTKNYTNSTQK